jgi:hypothetical protein
MSALAIAISRRYRPKPVVNLPPVAAKSLRDILCAPLVPNQAIATRQPTSIVQHTVKETNAQNTGMAEPEVVQSALPLVDAVTTHVTREETGIPQIAKAVDVQRLHIDDEDQCGKGNLGLGTMKGLRWADDPDLSPIPVLHTEPKQDMARNDTLQRPKGLINSRWAENEDQPTIPANEGRPKKETPNKLSKKPSKGLQDSRSAARDQPCADRQMLEHKLKRELAQYGVNKPNTAKSIQGPSQHITRPTAQPVARPAAQPAARPVPQPARKVNTGRTRNPNKGSRKPNRDYRRCETEDEAPRELPRVHMDWEEFNREVKLYGLKTLKDSRWADKDEEEEKPKDEEKPQETPRVKMDWEEFNREVEMYGLKTLKDSRWAN